MKIADLLAQTDKLPNVPEVVRELISTLNDPKARYMDIAKKISHDQTLSLKVLRIVNSAYFGLSHKVSSIEDAVVMLGMERLHTLVIASGFANSVSNVEGIDLKKFWGDTFRIAEMAKWFAQHSAGVNPDTAFTTGVVHSIGRLLLHLTEPNRAKAVQQLVAESNYSRNKAEMERFGFTSQEAGKALLMKWHFPQDVCDALVQYIKPNEESSDLACIMHLAAYLNAHVRIGDSKEEVIAHFPMKIALQSKVSMDVLNELDNIIEKSDELKALAA